MISNSEYQEMVESKFGKPLKDIMYDLCVIKDIVPSEGESILDVPQSTFLAWRKKFRFGRIQWQADKYEKRHSELVQKSKEKLKDVDIMRPFLISEDDKSILGFKELVERNLELWELKSANNGIEINDLKTVIRISILQETISLTVT